MGRQLDYNDNMNFEHQQWKGEIAFWEDELKSFNNKLSQLINRWSSKELLAKIGDFQTQFIFHGGVIEDLLETIEKHEMHMALPATKVTNALDTEWYKKHIEFRNRIETQREIYAELKKRFFRFLENYL